MNYQKIILVGEITNEPEVQKTKEGALTELIFEMTIKHFSEKIVFLVIVTFAADDIDDQKIVKGSEVLVEGVVDSIKNGKLLVRADWLENGGRGGRFVKSSKLLF